MLSAYGFNKSKRSLQMPNAQRRSSHYIYANVLWLIDYLLFYVPMENLLLIWKRHLCLWRAAKFRSILGAQGLWALRNPYRATLTVTRGLGFSSFIRRTAPFSRLLRHQWGCWGPILTRILAGRNVLCLCTSFVYIQQHRIHVHVYS
jgi:hypothetical protein